MVEFIIKSLFISTRFAKLICRFVIGIFILIPRLFFELWKQFRIELRASKYYEEVVDHCPDREKCTGSFAEFCNCNCYKQAEKDATEEYGMTKEEIEAHYQKKIEDEFVDDEFEKLMDMMREKKNDNVEK